MQNLCGSIVALATLAGVAAMPASAQQITVSGGVAATSNYISSGLTQSDDHPALQFYVEAQGQSGFYTGLWSSTVDFNDAEKLEFDLYLGYRHDFPNGMSADIVYTRYLYSSSGDCCGDIAASLEVPVTDKLTLTPKLTYDPEAKNGEQELKAEYAISDVLAASATIGHSDPNGGAFGDIGASYSVSDKLTVDGRYYDSDYGPGRFALTISFDTDLFTQ